jgi:hypothetical protein
MRKFNSRTAFAAACVLLVAGGCNKKTEEPTTTSADGKASTAPSGKQAANQKMALVRFVNAVPGQAVDLWFGDQSAFSNIAFRTVAPYRELPGERHDFQLRYAGAPNTGEPKAKNSEGLTDGARYTVVALLDKSGNPTLNVIGDNLTEPPAGKAKVRVINASRDEVDVLSPVTRKEHAATGDADRAARDDTREPHAGKDLDKWFGGVNPDSSTQYKEVDPVSAPLKVRSTAAKGVGPAINVPVDFAAGKLYTLVVTGGKGHALEVIRVTDELGTAGAAAGQ